jgi:hypothetical protein
MSEYQFDTRFPLLSIDNPEERARIMNAGGFVQAGRVNASLNLSRAIGDMEYKQNVHLPPREQIVTAYPEVRSVSLAYTRIFLVIDTIVRIAFGCKKVRAVKLSSFLNSLARYDCSSVIILRGSWFTMNAAALCSIFLIGKLLSRRLTCFLLCIVEVRARRRVSRVGL